MHFRPDNAIPLKQIFTILSEKLLPLYCSTVLANKTEFSSDDHISLEFKRGNSISCHLEINFRSHTEFYSRTTRGQWIETSEDKATHKARYYTASILVSWPSSMWSLEQAASANDLNSQVVTAAHRIKCDIDGYSIGEMTPIKQ